MANPAVTKPNVALAVRQWEFMLMWLISCALRRIVVLGLVALGAALPALPAVGQTLDLSLNVFYDVPFDDTSGGTWQVAAKSTGSFGIATLDLKLTGINLPPAVPVGPRGVVNGTDPAGFSDLTRFAFPTYINIIAGQLPAPEPLLPGEEQSIFYGVGTLADGEPGDLGPVFTTLTDLEASPWGTGDPLGEVDWDAAAILAAGTFAPGQMPSFATNAQNPTAGSVYTTLGTSTSPGLPTLVEAVTTIVRENRFGSPDYNNDGIVNAADYTVWRDTLGQSGLGLAADGTLDTIVDQADYAYCKANFGLVIPVAGGGCLAGGAVPEPGTGTLLVGVLLLVSRRRRTPVFRTLHTSFLPANGI